MALRRLDSVDAALGWLDARCVSRLMADSRRVRPGDAFIAWPGAAQDARRYLPQARAAGAVACLVELDGAERFEAGARDDVAALPRLKAATGTIASRFLGEPSHALDVVAATGTNGKTSMTWWTAQAISALGRRCGVIGTLGVGEPPSATRPQAIRSTGLTTPDPITLQSAFRDFVDAGLRACAIEASSIGLAEDRLAGTKIDVALFSNLTLDHLDYHGSMAAYRDAKARLFAWPGLRAAVLNTDDAQGRAFADALPDSIDTWTCAVDRSARLRATGVRYVDGGLCFCLEEGGQAVPVTTRLIGSYNVGNVLVVVGGLRALGVPLADAARVCEVLTPVPGRMQRVPAVAGEPQIVVDYAHTPDALEHALAALQPFAAERGGGLWCVFGCGGDRDATKRPLMGAIAARLADHVVVTSDNPRLEAPGTIIEQVLAGIGDGSNVAAIESRAEAIASAVHAADPRDVILLAGKGHEDYQDIGGRQHHFSDVEQAAAALRARHEAAACR